MSESRLRTVTYKGVEFEVEFDYFPPYKGARDSLGGVANAGPPLEEDEEESIDITGVWCNCGEDLYSFLTAETFKGLESEIMDVLADSWEEEVGEEEERSDREEDNWP